MYPDFNDIGQAPISTGIRVGIDKFYSIFRDTPTIDGGSGKWGRRYLETTRGMLATRESVKSADYSKVYKFQFNPQNVSDVKSTSWEEVMYAGMPYIDLIWGGGGVRNVSFQLFLDNTPQSKTLYFLGNGNEGEHINKNGMFTADGFQTVKTNNKGYSASRYSERGVLDEVEFLQSFMYPAQVGEEQTPKFAEGGVVSLRQFRPPSIACLALGPIYLEGIVRRVDINYTLFDKDLTPLRATADIELSIFEYYKPRRVMDKTTKR